VGEDTWERGAVRLSGAGIVFLEFSSPPICSYDLSFRDRFRFSSKGGFSIPIGYPPPLPSLSPDSPNVPVISWPCLLCYRLTSSPQPPPPFAGGSLSNAPIGWGGVRRPHLWLYFWPLDRLFPRVAAPSPLETLSRALEANFF